ncbi:unnamed protein product [Darwinula stevensoni]|uniref:Uncharacterized protein n=1 Tax=Darwinula stevensoni TaxID=69355 RepID=A0A7R9A1W3_9CRUS|nr:unnamed protein product [Darwinula stevensoni]CAG0878665.1 unnamed protein product [Darwinula stevensoni]
MGSNLLVSPSTSDKEDQGHDEYKGPATMDILLEEIHLSGPDMLSTFIPSEPPIQEEQTDSDYYERNGGTVSLGPTDPGPVRADSNGEMKPVQERLDYPTRPSDSEITLDPRGDRPSLDQGHVHLVGRGDAPITIILHYGGRVPQLHLYPVDSLIVPCVVLVGGGGVRSHRLFRPIVIGGIVAVVMILLLVTIAVLTHGGQTSESTSKALSLPHPLDGTGGDPLALKDFLRGSIPQIFMNNGSWISDTEISFTDDFGVMAYDVSTAIANLLIPGRIMGQTGGYREKFSADRSFAAIISDPQKVYRHSFLSRYFLFSLKTGAVIPLVVQEQGNEDSSSPDLLQSLEWAPVGASLYFVYDNNLYYVPHPEANKVFKLTVTGIPGMVFNGVADWVYEEEILSDHKAAWWSPTGKFLAYASFNDTDVPEIQYPIYGPLKAHWQYPDIQSIHYPKPGRLNPTVELWVVDLSETGPAKSFRLLPPREFQSVDHYFSRVTWADPETVAITWMNRRQNVSIDVICHASTWQCKQIHTTIVPNGWLENFQPLSFSKLNPAKYLAIRSVDQPGIGSFPHIVLGDANTGQNVPITSGALTVDKILHWNEKDGKVYFVGTEARAAEEYHFYEADAKKPGSENGYVCVSCRMKNKYGEPCKFVNVEMSKEGSYYALDCMSYQAPPETNVFLSHNHQLVMKWLDNDEIREEMAEKDLPLVRNLVMPVEGGFSANVRLLLPRAALNSTNKFPMIVYTYAGPNTRAVDEKFPGITWEKYLASRLGIVVATIDGRGSGFKGNDFLFTLNRALGTVEVEDQIDVTRQGRLPFSSFLPPFPLWISSETILPQEADSTYTERFMGVPAGNEEGYEQTDLTRRVKDFQGKFFYLIHGNADDNVHYQQSMMLSKALEKGDVLFRQQSYPDEDHSLTSVRKHFYHSMQEFWAECFDLPIKEYI